MGELQKDLHVHSHVSPKALFVDMSKLEEVVEEMTKEFPEEEGHAIPETWADEVQKWRKKWLEEE